MPLALSRLVSMNSTIRFMQHRMIAFVLSILLIGGSFGSLVVNGLNFGIDFTGGIVIEVRFKDEVNLPLLRKILGKVSLQEFGVDHDVMIRINNPEDGKSQAETIANVQETILKHFKKEDVTFRKTDYVGPQVGKELIQSGALALMAAFAAILIYIWLRFEWQYGAGALIALIHDAILTVGFFSITGLEFNLSSIAAILAIIGYSINDSVVIYDRIRENTRKYKKQSLEETIDKSVNETLSRTLLTAGTTLVAVLALILFGGHVVQSFSAAVFFGVAIGTYSSVYIAAPVLIHLHLSRSLKAAESTAS